MAGGGEGKTAGYSLGGLLLSRQQAAAAAAGVSERRVVGREIGESKSTLADCMHNHSDDGTGGLKGFERIESTGLRQETSNSCCVHKQGWIHNPRFPWFPLLASLSCLQPSSRWPWVADSSASLPRCFRLDSRLAKCHAPHPRYPRYPRLSSVKAVLERRMSVGINHAMCWRGSQACKSFLLPCSPGDRWPKEAQGSSSTRYLKTMRSPTCLAAPRPTLFSARLPFSPSPSPSPPTPHRKFVERPTGMYVHKQVGNATQKQQQQNRRMPLPSSRRAELNGICIYLKPFKLAGSERVWRRPLPPHSFTSDFAMVTHTQPAHSFNPLFFSFLFAQMDIGKNFRSF
ncbi:hypothetical protein FN846DRAFT_166890 [Sphaerosporella brunnea]|uniref:Uncharacterized protein n=1 Tax=Sphaerosporella brunnea TaxID=1250544 RepID=A0A5J5EPN5_9PEZI|nr:hypothetical protein FN846DRAFT_166890 [Sphaerosporella brunnea]